MTLSISRMAAHGLLGLATLALAACSGGSSSSLGGGGQTPPPDDFKVSDLNGDWVGQLDPADPNKNERNVYLRFVDQVLTEAAESGGNQWNQADSERQFEFTADGVLTLRMEGLSDHGVMTVTASMDASLTVLEGTFRIVENDGRTLQGDLLMTRSPGAGAIPQDMLEGFWDGLGKNGSGKFRFLKLQMDVDGVVLDGLMKHSETEVKIRDYSEGSGEFVMIDTSVGRVDGLVLTSDQGETITFDFLLLDLDGTLLAGPGVESELGEGVAHLVRP